MTPTEHYAKAEKILEESKTIWEIQVKPLLDNSLISNADEVQAILTAFQVRTGAALAHATLATVRP